MDFTVILKLVALGIITAFSGMLLKKAGKADDCAAYVDQSGVFRFADEQDKAE